MESRIAEKLAHLRTLDREAMQRKAAGERIVKAGIVSPAIMQLLEENLKAFRGGRKL